MPDSRPLDELRHRLAHALTLPQPLQVPRGWSNEAAMVTARRKVQESFNGLSAPPSEDTILGAVQTFARQQQTAGFTHIKHLCYGLNLPTAPNAPLLIQSPQLFDHLLDQVDEQRREPRRFRRCYQALLQSYFVYDRALGEDTLRSAHQRNGDRSFETLRVYLKDQLWLVAQPVGRQPAATWAVALAEHDNLLGTAPCDRYVDELGRGLTHSLQSVCTALGVSRQSWIWQEVILAYLRSLCAQPDAAFQSHMGSALDIADERTELKPGAAVARQIVARVVSRYERCQTHPEHPRLRDMSVHHIGNPWIKRAAWDAFVAYEPARKMVESWLKGRLIRDFFELLSHDGKAEQQRLDYWLRFEPVIEDMWFVLGVSARNNRTPEFKALRQRMEGRRRDLVGTTSNDNNAFVMRIGNLLLVEFGVTGNACFVHNWLQIRDQLDKEALDIDAVLKRHDRILRMPHQGAWQVRFDSKICHLIGFRPEGEGGNAGRATNPINTQLPLQPPSLTTPYVIWPEVMRVPTTSRWTPQHKPSTSQPTDPTEQSRWLLHVMRVASERGLMMDDRRSKGGALWVLTSEPIPPGTFRTALERAGFIFKTGKGYWLATP